MIEPVVVVVPAYNADASVEAVVKGVKLHLPKALVLGVDDGSTDGTRAVLILADEAQAAISFALAPPFRPFTHGSKRSRRSYIAVAANTCT